MNEIVDLLIKFHINNISNLQAQEQIQKKDREKNAAT